MARLFDDASSEYLEYSGAIYTSYPFAFVGWAYLDANIDPGIILSEANSSNTYRLGIALLASSGTVYGQIFSRAATNEWNNSTVTGSLNEWMHVSGLFVATDDRRLFTNGGDTVTDVDNVSPSGMNTTSIGRCRSSTPFGYMSGGIAEVAIYDLSVYPGATASDKADNFEAVVVPALAKGASPLTIPLGLVAYWPEIRTDQDVVGGYDMTPVNTPSIADHPPAAYHRAPPLVMGVPAAGGGPDYTLTADAGSYTLTGTAADLLVSRLLDAAAGTYTLTGMDAALLASRLLDAGGGSFTLTGADAGLLASRLLDAAAGTFTMTGADAGLLASRLLDAAAGTYTLTGTDAALLASRLLDAEGGAFTLTGTDAGLLVSRLLDAAAGAFTLTGIDVTLDYSGAGAPDYTLTAEAGSYTLTGADAGLLASRLLTADGGVYTLTGADADILRRFVLDAEAGSYTLTGADAALVLSRLLDAEPGTFALGGTSVTLVYSGAAVAITPDCRIYVVEAEDRVYVIAVEDRTMRIPAEDRTYTIRC